MVPGAGPGSAQVGDRLEADLKFAAHDFYVLGEYIHGWDTTNQAKAIEGHGIYVEGAYTFFDHLQPMLRVGDLEPDMDKAGDHFWHYEAGVAWLFQKKDA